MTITFPGADRPLPDEGLRERREAVATEHMVTELAGDIDAALATMPDGPHYSFKPLGRDHHGEEVRDLLNDMLGAFADLTLAPITVHHSADALIIEARMSGTQVRDWAGIPNKGGTMDVEGCVIFRFDGERMTNETVYFDLMTVMGQLTA